MKKVEVIRRIFKYVNNPFSFMCNHFMGRECIIRLKCGARMSYKSGFGAIYTLVQVLDKGYKISNSDNDLLIETDDDLKFIQPNVGCLNEDFRAMYLDQIDVKGRCVFDIGGFYGESALYFSKIGGASKVFIYEPLSQNCQIIENNIALNNVENIKTINMGVSSENGILTINSDYPPGSSAFGAGGVKYSVDVIATSWGELLLNAVENNAYLIKSDCEGAERYIFDLDHQLISKIPNYIIEIHSKEDKSKIDAMFSKLGYEISNIKGGAGQISISKYSQCCSA
jgi:FkbM family methyltransferase